MRIDERTNISELENKLKDLFEELDDTEVLRDAILSQDGHHIPGAAVARRFADEIDRLNEKIDAVKTALDRTDV
ncbi:MAG: hypothetical protein LBD85_04770 [Oscillospiraceae bacterium]|jgi:hypothetical protein|nr:hypothetical protein [Oscillospiraceae bacterium]